MMNDAEKRKKKKIIFHFPQKRGIACINGSFENCGINAGLAVSLTFGVE